MSSSVFSTANYATGLKQRLRRSLELGPKYYIVDVPRYLNQRRKLGLSMLDVGVVWNPLRSFSHQSYLSLPMPPHYSQALMELEKAGIRLDNPPARIEGLVGLWWQSARNGVPGDVIECGSYRGATALLLAVLGKLEGVKQSVLMLDTFEGMPAPSGHDTSRRTGEYTPPKGWVDTIRQQVDTLGVKDRIEIHQGLFADTFKAIEHPDLRFAFAHIDANIFQGTLDACEFVLPHVSSGGSIVFDDYNGLCDLGARLAIDSSLAGKIDSPRPLAECSAYVTL